MFQVDVSSEYMLSLREHSSLRPFFAISYLRELKVCVWVSNVKKMN